MRILIPYDGTKNAENALLELHNEKFGRTDEILVVITDVWLPESVEEIFEARRKLRLEVEGSGNSSFVAARRKLEIESFLREKVRKQFSKFYPELNIKIESLPGFSLVSSEVLEKAARWKADLIILGKLKDENEAAINGYKPGFWRVVSEARCPVHFAYGNGRGSFAIKPFYSFVAENESQNGEQKSKNHNTVNNIAGIGKWQAESSIQVITSTELSKETQIPTMRRLLKPQRRIKKFKTTGAALAV